jgi:putative FmdB family regulatory protein
VPLYEYECTKCHRRFERIEKVAGPHLAKCPKCKGKMERTITSSAIQFKGSGWYVTDYASKSAGDGSAKDSKTEAKESKETAPPKESKKETPAKK